MKLSLNDVIFLSKESENIIITKWLEDLEKLINKTPNDFDLGEKIRKIV